MYNTLEKSLNLDTISEYAKKVSEEIINIVFENRDTNIGTTELKSLTTIEQVNFFVIQEIFNSWWEQSESLKSEFFDYNNQEIKTIHEQYVNTISQHISLNKSQCLELIEKAIVNCLILLLCPYDFYHNLLSELQKQNKLGDGVWQKVSKYIRINGELKDRIDDTLTNLAFDEDVNTIMNTSCDKIVNPPEPIEPIFDNFKTYVDVDIESFFLEKEEEREEEEREEEEREEKKRNEEEREGEERNEEEEKEERNEEEERELISLADNLEEKDQITMNDQLESDAYSSDIHDLISINQRFMFIQELFDTDNNLYDKTLSEIDKMEDEYQAQKYLEDNICKEYEWDFESEEVIEFMKVVRVRFQK